SDGAAGLIGAIEQVYPKALRQRCLIHRNCKEITWRGLGLCLVLWGGGLGPSRRAPGGGGGGGVGSFGRRGGGVCGGGGGEGGWGVGVEARWRGQGGVRAVAGVAGVSESTVRKGVFELEEGQDPFPDGRARREGGGRRSAEELDAGLVPALLALVEPDERGDPESPLRWTTKSARPLAGGLARRGHPVSAPTVGRLLRGAGFSLQATAKTLEGAQHPDRDAQFRYITEQVKDHQAGGEPVISVDTKKREQLGRLPMAGREWRP